DSSVDRDHGRGDLRVGQNGREGLRRSSARARQAGGANGGVEKVRSPIPNRVRTVAASSAGSLSRWPVLQEHPITDEDLDPQRQIKDDAVERWAAAIGVSRALLNAASFARAARRGSEVRTLSANL